MDRRLQLQMILEKIKGPKGVYFQPPENIQLKYPCIVYARVTGWNRKADNNTYVSRKRYDITVIDRNPDSNIPQQVESLEHCSFSRHFISDGLNHDVFTIYF